MSRVAVIFFEGKSRKKSLEIAQGLSKGIESQGHRVDIIDGERDVNTKLTSYNYLAVGTSAINGFGGKISERVSPYLAGAGTVAGKRSFAFAIKGGMRISKTLNTIMKAMEREGLYLKYSEILSSSIEAEAIGKRLHIDK